ncbi:MAG: RecX family transcriptional regulator [Bacteroidia bacterium]|nr:RecX family transcriptional regulator [Bacteroidia bacterium]
MNEEILVKIYKYCAYQDRSQKEILEKLADLGVEGEEETEKILEHLRIERFWDEERFARNFARGKFRIKGWGKLKIRRELRMKGVPKHLIEIAVLEEIEVSDYTATLEKFLLKKKKELKAAPAFTIKVKVYNYLSQKGFEDEVIYKAMDRLIEND